MIQRSINDRIPVNFLFIGFSFMILWIYSRPFSVERLKRWWNGQPEPKVAPALPPPAASAGAPGT